MKESIYSKSWQRSTNLDTNMNNFLGEIMIKKTKGLKNAVKEDVKWGLRRKKK